MIQSFESARDHRREAAELAQMIQQILGEFLVLQPQKPELLIQLEQTEYRLFFPEEALRIGNIHLFHGDRGTPSSVDETIDLTNPPLTGQMILLWKALTALQGDLAGDAPINLVIAEAPPLPDLVCEAA